MRSIGIMRGIDVCFIHVIKSLLKAFDYLSKENKKLKEEIRYLRMKYEQSDESWY